ncbi:MAG: chemoreceptor glutamine deamidase CheD [Rubrivivax sp.]
MTTHAQEGSLRTSAEVTRRLEALKNAARQPGEAQFFWFDTQFQKVAVKVLPGEYAAYSEDVMIATTLGSCIACCVWDRESHVGGMNHFMLPDGSGEGGGRFGAYAMEQLINAVLKMGARRLSLEAKLFGGGQVLAGMTTMNIGERNTQFALDYLRTERIPVVSSDVLDIYPRKVAFLPVSGRAMVKRLPGSQGHAISREERQAQAVVGAGAGAGAVELF